MKSKKIIKLLLTGVLLVNLQFLTSCGDEKEDPDPTFADPTIDVSVAEEDLAPVVGSTVEITIVLEAEAGLSGLFLGETSVESFAGTEMSATVTYEQLIANEDPITLNFVVEDAQGTKITAETLTLNPVPGVDLGYLLADFAGASSSEEEKTVASWDIRSIWTMAVSGEIGTSATVENVAGQGDVLQFAAANPDPNEDGKVLKYSKNEGATSTGAWGGWTNLIVGLSGKVPSSEISALPKYDRENNTLVAGTKVVAVDVYYDATVDQDFSWSDIASFEEGGDIWNADVSKGLKIDLVLGEYAIHANNEVGYDNAGYYISYAAYLSEPNKWVTVEFNLLDEGRTAFFYDNRDEANSSNSVGPDAVDCFNFKVSPGYDAASGGDGIDTNPIYFKNLRIIDVE